MLYIKHTAMLKKVLKIRTPSDTYYLSLVWIYPDIKFGLNSSILATSNID
jgi:hypothetical protein